jgi:hypothetical protein
MYGESALILFTFDENKKLAICTTEDTSPPATTGLIIAMIDESGSE